MGHVAIPSSSSSSSSHILALPLKKSEPLDLYESLRNYFVLKYSESVAKSVEGLLELLNKLRSEMLRDDLSLPLRRDCLILYYKCLCMIEPLFPMTSSSNPPIFVWYNAFNPQQNPSQHNIHLEKASVLFNLGALGSHIALSCDLTTIQGQRIAIDALHDASYWFLLVTHEAEKASATIDLSISCTQMLHEIISAQVFVLYRKAFDMSTLGPLAETRVQSLTAQHLLLIMRTCLIEFAPSDVTEQFLVGYCKAAQFLTGYRIPVGCQPPCLDLLSKTGPVMIKDGNLVANLSGSDIRIGGDELPGDHSNMAIDQN
nr:vacuolar-sorting protein BRO1 isoform X3 [Arachis hypogaea]